MGRMRLEDPVVRTQTNQEEGKKMIEIPEFEAKVPGMTDLEVKVQGMTTDIQVKVPGMMDLEAKVSRLTDFEAKVPVKMDLTRTEMTKR